MTRVAARNDAQGGLVLQFTGKLTIDQVGALWLETMRQARRARGALTFDLAAVPIATPPVPPSSPPPSKPPATRRTCCKPTPKPPRS